MSAAILAVIVGFICFLLGSFIGGIFTSAHFRKQIKKNPLITPDQIRELYTRMGKKPTETQIRQMMNYIKNK